MKFTIWAAVAAAVIAALLRTDAGIGALLTVTCQFSADRGRRALQHHGNASDAEVLLPQTGDRNSIFGLQLLVVC